MGTGYLYPRRNSVEPIPSILITPKFPRNPSTLPWSLPAPREARVSLGYGPSTLPLRNADLSS